MKNLIDTGLFALTLGMAALAEPVEKTPTTQPAPATIVTTTSSSQEAPAQPDVKKEQQPLEKAQAQPAPVKPKKPVELNFRNF